MAVCARCGLPVPLAEVGVWLVRPERAEDAWDDTCGKDCGSALYHSRGRDYQGPSRPALFTD